MDIKEIKGYEGLYEAHSDGTIWSCKNKTTYSFVRGKTIKRRAASEFLGKNKGYLSNIIKSGRTLGNYEIVVGEI